MDEFKKKLQNRQLFLVSGLLLACGAVMLTRGFVKELSASRHIQGFVEGFQAGILIALACALTVLFFRNILAMQNPERLKKLYISETDERKQFIMQRTGHIGMNIAMYGLAAGTAVAGNFNETVFFTLFGACLFVTLVRVSLKLYCRSRY